MAFKVYCGLSSRRYSTDLLEAHGKGLVTKPIPWFEGDGILRGSLLHADPDGPDCQDAAPLAVVETEFAVDSSDFSSSRFIKWYDEK